MHNDPYHYPPDLVAVLVDTVPILVRSKPDTLEFFRGAGVAPKHLADLERRLVADRSSVGKYEIARTVIYRINAEGESGLRTRREIVRRVVDWGDFSTCWPEKALQAQGLAAKVRDLVNVKDAFTRMQQERERERHERLRPQREAAAAAERKRTEREALLRELGALFPMANAHQRGLAFERLLNQIFKLDGLNVREGFALSTESGQIGEQIDGLVELGLQPYLVEAKWWKNPLGVDGVAQHLVRVYSRPGVYGLIVSASEFADTAVQQCRHALTQRVIVLAELREIVMLLERQGNFATWLQAKTRAAAVDRNPLFFPRLAQAA
ncbi:MAG: restriction endonuclease [Pseudonocardiaceae bacterium]